MENLAKLFQYYIPYLYRTSLVAADADNRGCRGVVWGLLLVNIMQQGWSSRIGIMHMRVGCIIVGVPKVP